MKNNSSDLDKRIDAFTKKESHIEENNSNHSSEFNEIENDNESLPGVIKVCLCPYYYLK